jgi:dihydrofolate reductase
LSQKNKNFFFTKLLKNYYTRKNQIKKILKKVAFHINLKKKNNKIIFYGGGKILSSLFNAGLSNNNVLFAVDNFLYDKIKNNNLIPIFSSKKLNDSSKVTSIIILARNAENEIFAELKRKRFKNIILISDLIKKYE